MALNARRTMLLAKAESTYGTDPTPDTTNDALIAYDVELTPEIDPLERIDKGLSLSRPKELAGKQRVTLSFTTELRGSGTAGTAVKGDKALWKACGFAETIVGGASVTYRPRSSSFESATIYVYLDGVQHQIHGCIGDCEIVFVAGETAKVNWTITGLWETPTDQTFPTSWLPASTVPVVCKNMTATFDSYAAVIRELSIKMNNQVIERASLAAATGVAGFQITDRSPEGEIMIESIPLATKDYWAKLTADTTVALSLVLGGTAGNINTISAPFCRMRQIPWSDEDGILTHPIEFQLSRVSGNDELTIAQT